MTVAAGTRKIVNPPASPAGKDRRAAVRCAAVGDGVDNFKMLWGHAIAEALDILGTICFENIVNCDHGRLLSSSH